MIFQVVYLSEKALTKQEEPKSLLGCSKNTRRATDSSFKKTDITGASHVTFGPSYFVRALDTFTFLRVINKYRKGTIIPGSLYIYYPHF